MCLYVCVCAFEIIERGRRIVQKTSTTNDVCSKLDDFSHAKIHRHHISATASVEKDDDAARNVGSIDFHSPVDRSFLWLNFLLLFFLLFFFHEQLIYHCQDLYNRLRKKKERKKEKKKSTIVYLNTLSS